MQLIDGELWAKTRAGARAGRGFRYQDAATAWFIVEAWAGRRPWTVAIPEGLEDTTLHNPKDGLEFRVQIKSKHDSQGKFSLGEVASYLVIAARKLADVEWRNPQVRLALVLERAVLELTASGWDIHLASIEGAPFLEEKIRELLEDSDPFTAHDLLTKSHLVVEGEPLDLAVEAISNRQTVLPAIARLVIFQLKTEAGLKADQNYLASHEAPEHLSIADVQQAIDRCVLMVDSTSAEEALSRGICEVVDWAPLHPHDFYSGLDVQPGHVSAGLVFDRPLLVANILESLEVKPTTLISGLSGSGKSAAAWLSAYASRHVVRWYRVRRLEPSEVHLLIRLAQALEATIDRPVGFILDDVGRDFQATWDAFAKDINSSAGILGLGTIREEDLFLLRSTSTSSILRPELDQILAERIWSALQQEGKAKLPHWKEAFEKSNGLLLEFVHLVTQGQRLEETVGEQIRRRIQEKRDDELKMLNVIAFAAAHGGSVKGASLRAELNIDELDFSRALHRLVDEHAIKVSDEDTLTGIHDLRSTQIEQTIKALGAFSRDSTVQQVVRSMSRRGFAPFIRRVLQRDLSLRAPLIAALCERLGKEGPEVFAAALHGLGLANCERVASRWLEITRSEDIDDRFAAFTLQFATAGVDFASLPNFAQVNKAIWRFPEIDEEDARCLLIDVMDPSRLPEPTSLQEINQLAAAVLPVSGCKRRPEIWFGVDSLALSTSYDLPDALRTLQTVGEADPELACKLADRLNALSPVLDRLFHETPWLTQPVVDGDDGQAVISANLRFVSPDIQTQTELKLIALCETLLAADPHVTVAKAKAVAGNNEPMEIAGFVFEREMDRSRLVAKARVAWNRALLRAVQGQIGAPNETQRLSDLASLIRQSSAHLTEAIELYCRMEKPSAKWAILHKVHQMLTSMVPLPTGSTVPEDLSDNGELELNDVVHGFAASINSLISDLVYDKIDRPKLAAANAADLAISAQALTKPDVWKWVSSPPTEALEQCRNDLLHLRAILENQTLTGKKGFLHLARTSRKSLLYPRISDEAHKRASAIASANCLRWQGEFAQVGLNTIIITKPLKEEDKGRHWPAVNYAFLVEIRELLDLFKTLEAIVEILPRIDLVGNAVIVPTMSSKVLDVFAVTYIRQVLPYADFKKDWEAYLPMPLLHDPLSPAFSTACDALVLASTAVAGAGRPFNAEEEAFIQSASEGLSDAIACLSRAWEEDKIDAAIYALDVLQKMGNQLTLEVEGKYEGETIAVGAFSGLKGVIGDVGMKSIECRMAFTAHYLGIELA